MKTVHEFFTNKRMEGARFVHSWSHSWMVVWVRAESLQGRMSEAERQVENLFEALLSQTFSN